MRENVTQLLIDWNEGDPRALERLLPLVYDELHRLARHYMRRERSDHTLQPTALVNEAYLRLIDQTRVRWQGRAHFVAIAAQLMRRVTVKHAERRRAQKRGGDALRVPVEDHLPSDRARETDVLALNDALERLRSLDERQSQIVEMRFFGGLTSEEMGEVLELSRSTIDREWRAARAWLKRELGPATPIRATGS